MNDYSRTIPGFTCPWCKTFIAQGQEHNCVQNPYYYYNQRGYHPNDRELLLEIAGMLRDIKQLLLEKNA